MFKKLVSTCKAYIPDRSEEVEDQEIIIFESTATTLTMEKMMNESVVIAHVLSLVRC